MKAQANALTAEEYFLIALPTAEDFAAWTRGLHAWADEIKRAYHDAANKVLKKWNY